MHRLTEIQISYIGYMVRYVLPLVFAVWVKHFTTLWVDRMLRRRAARKRSVNGSMAVRTTTFESAPWYQRKD